MKRPDASKEELAVTTPAGFIGTLILRKTRRPDDETSAVL